MYGKEYRQFMHVMYDNVECLVTQYYNSTPGTDTQVSNYINISKFSVHRSSINSWFNSVYGKREMYIFKQQYGIGDINDPVIENSIVYRHRFLNNFYRGRYVHEILAVRILYKININVALRISRALSSSNRSLINVIKSIQLIDHPEYISISPNLSPCQCVSILDNNQSVSEVDTEKYQCDNENYTLSQEFSDLAEYILLNTTIQENNAI